ncbi:hypothetical protein G419_02595 [Rhodococcus triatomae BKS 15-14]|nr:hypothetical protein G419_02595 [Rhodococcus triatomae BKS 15-14]
MRGGFVGSLSGALTVAAHGIGGGMAPSQSSVVLLVLACSAVGALVSATRARRHDLLFLVGALAAGQALGHATLSVGAGAHHGLQLGPAMLAAHAVAAVVTAVLVRAGGRGCQLAVASLRSILPTPFAPVPAPALPARPVPAARRQLRRWLLVGARLGTRGPPILV